MPTNDLAEAGRSSESAAPEGFTFEEEVPFDGYIDWSRVSREQLTPTLREAFDVFAETRSEHDAMTCVRDLVTAFGGNVVSICTQRLIEQRHRARGIREALDRGTSRRRIAQRYGVSLRTVERVAQDVGA